MAQLVERYVRNVQATSSNLVISTTRDVYAHFNLVCVFVLSSSTSPNLKRTPFTRTVLGFFFAHLSCYRTV